MSNRISFIMGFSLGAILIGTMAAGAITTIDKRATDAEMRIGVIEQQLSDCPLSSTESPGTVTATNEPDDSPIPGQRQ